MEFMRLVLLVYLTASFAQAQPKSPASGAGKTSGCAIKVNEVGPIRGGMTIRAARQALPGATFKLTEEIGGQISFFAVTRAGKKLFDIYPDQQDGIKETSKVETIRVYDAECKTADGLYPGMPLIGAETTVGPLKRLVIEQSEKREYAQFEKLPSWLEIQTGSGEAGLYEPGQHCTAAYKADARVESLWVSHPIEHNVLDSDDA